MTLFEWLRRRRATKGYGVHSPLAFRLMKNVVRPPRDVRYYGEERLMVSEEPYEIVRRARLLLRLTAELQTSYVWFSPGTPPLLTEAVLLAGGVIRVYDGELYPDELTKADMAVLYNFKIKKADLKKIMKPGKTLVAFNIRPKVAEWTEQLLQGGVLLEGVESLVAVNTPLDGAHIYRISKF